MVGRDKTLDRALDRLRKPGAALVLTYNRNTVSGRSFHIQPDGVRIADETAQKLLEHPRVQPCDDGLFPGCAQSWKLGDWAHLDAVISWRCSANGRRFLFRRRS